MSDDPDNLVLNLLRIIRSELAEHRTLRVGLVDQGQRTERRMGELDRRFETRIEAQIEALSQRSARLDEAT